MKTPPKHRRARALTITAPLPGLHQWRRINPSLNALGMRLWLAGAMVLTASSGFAQGTVHFGNRELPDPPDRRVRDVSGQPVVGANFMAQLLYETSPGSLTPHTAIARFYASPNLAGWWQAIFPLRLDGAGGVGVPVRLQIRAWDGAVTGMPMLTFEQAMAAGNQWGVSEIFTYVQRQSLPSDPTDEYMLEFRGFQLVPEPGTWALLALGFGVLFWKCRRCRSR
jgi:hypothetical protein